MLGLSVYFNSLAVFPTHKMFYTTWMTLIIYQFSTDQTCSITLTDKFQFQSCQSSIILFQRNTFHYCKHFTAKYTFTVLSYFQHKHSPSCLINWVNIKMYFESIYRYIWGSSSYFVHMFPTSSQLIMLIIITIEMILHVLL